VRQDLEWHSAEWNGKSLHPVAAGTMEIDASKLECGATCKKVKTGGHWTPQERELHINQLELRGRVICSEIIHERWDQWAHSFTTDNQTEMSWIRLLAEYLPGLESIVVDKESCWIRTSTEWKLHSEVFNLVQQVWIPVR